ncbi:MAG TPA: efflux RND transporter periplasmic adaptor subunit [Candidatus Cryptobacteroides pullicola]|nr:efflux RND transporter periplasmic adaptor subunit [Candidatus Cryptobacteroides pullicola]
MQQKYLLLAALCLLAAAACQNKNEDHDHGTASEAEAHAHEGEAAHGEIVLSPERAREAGVEVETIQPGKFSSAIRTSGVLSPSGKGSATVTSLTSGILSWNGATPVPGQRVSDGETIARVSAGGMGAGDAVTRAAIAFEAAEKEYLRAKGLLEDRIISQREFTAIEADYLTAKNAYQGSSADGAGNGVAVSSPIDGSITGVLKTEGDYVAAGEAIATVSSDSRLRLTADLPEKYASLRNSISGVNFKLHYGDTPVCLTGTEGRPVSVGRSVSATSAYIPVTFEFANRYGLMNGSYVEAWLLTDSRDGVISVPESALTEEQGEFFVYVRLDEECYRKVPVTLGGRNGVDVEIVSGLDGGEDVVVKGAYQVRLSAASVIPGHTHNH